MLALSSVSHEHDAQLRDYVKRLYALADCLGADCLDTSGVLFELDELQELERCLREMLIPHMDAVEASVYPAIERLMRDRETNSPLRLEHAQIRHLVVAIGDIVDVAGTRLDRCCVLTLRRVMLRLHVLLKAHLDEEERYLPILEDGLTPEGTAALGRALDHRVAARP